MRTLQTASSPTNFKSALSVRGDSLYCPLCFSLDSYWNCLTNCWHCYLRRLNATWGQDLRPADPEQVDRQLTNGLKNSNPQTPLAHCLAQKKTIRLGNKTDPFQMVEREYQVSKRLLKILLHHKWSFVIQTRFTEVLLDYQLILGKMAKFGICTVMPVISPGMEFDWEVFERKRTTYPEMRMEHLRFLKRMGLKGGVNGEPFIPGVHTVKNFETILKLLKMYGIDRYNTYNFHFNAFVAKRIHENCPGVDIEKIWFYNQDDQWKPILQKLIDLSKKYNIKLGCPDFVNSGWNYIEPSNTCCGVDVPNPCTFNTHHFKKLLQQKLPMDKVLEQTWDGSGSYSLGKDVLEGSTNSFYTLKDAKID